MPTDSIHQLIVPFAQSAGDGWLEAATGLALKNLSQLLRGMKLVATDAGQANSLSPPHERVLAKAWGVFDSADGLIPWAALEAKAKPQQAWAYITPCHWAMGREHATFTDSAALELSQAESDVLLAAMQPYFVTEGITLHGLDANRWLAEGEIFASLPTASLDRVMGRNVDNWLPPSKAIKLLQNEMQMLLYTHPVNDERAAKGQRTVNSFWVSGSGALTAPATTQPQVNTNRCLAQAAIAQDWEAYAHAWQQLDSTDIAQLLAQQKSGQTMRLSLCGESHAMTFETAQHGLLTRIKQTISPQHPMTLLQQL